MLVLHTTTQYVSILPELSPQTSKMDTVQITCTLKNVKSFLGVFPSDLLPHSITQPSTVIVNTDTHTQTGSHWLAIRLEPRASTAFYFDSYGLSPHIHDIQSFLRRNCTVLNYNNTTSRTSEYCLWQILLSVRPVYG